MSEVPESTPDEGISTNNIVDMMLSGGRTGCLDAESLIKETQKRVWGSLKKGYEYDYSADESDQFLRNHVSQRQHMIVMFVDLVG
ncbi:MAG: adenylate/guanylate cyclase domain-containing protein, partial [Thaumarchaeota archaeon]|nr:adenylate/guanylate cyclase domain-containing protein [Nitrososphaerota archaeon]